MTDTSHSPQTAPKESGFARFLRATEIDPRLLGMIGALVLISVGFHLFPSLDAFVRSVYNAVVNGVGTVGEAFGLLTPANLWDSGDFLTPRNLWNLSVQTAYIGVMATGMVLVIITRNIDLSVGSIMGVVGMYMGLMQVHWLPDSMGLGLGHPAIWIITALFGILVGTLIGALQGSMIAYLAIPSFIVTLGGLLVWRGMAFLVEQGKTIAPLDETFSLIGGGSFGALGGTGSWILAGLACAVVIWAAFNGRNSRRRHGFPLRPVWAEGLVSGSIIAAILGATAVVNSYIWPTGNIQKYYTNLGEEVPECGQKGGDIYSGVCASFSHGYAFPVLILIVVAVAMTILMTRTRFGRYVFAIGGNPEAAALSGINTRLMTVKIFALMGGLAGLAAVIGSARQNSATNAMGNLDELYVIAAAVVGGTSLAGGVGTIYGAIIGALILTGLQTGMVLIGFGDGSYQRIVIGGALVLAVWLDIVYRKRIK